MNHIKSYNESMNEEFSQDIKDICLELTDDGFLIHNKVNNYHIKKLDGSKFERSSISIRIVKPKGLLFSYKEVNDVILRILEYSEMCGVDSKVLSKSTKTEYDDITPFFKRMKYKIGNTYEIKIVLRK